MEQGFSYSEFAYRKLEHLCITKYYDKYLCGSFDDSYAWMEKELSYIKKQGTATLIIGVYEAIAAIEARNEDFCLKGVEGSSVVLHILGLSEIDPINLSPKVYPEFCFGLEGDRKLSIEIFITPKAYESLVRYFDNYNGEARVRHHHWTNGTLHGVRFSDPQINIGIHDENEYSFGFHLLEDSESFKSACLSGDAFDEIMPNTFEDQVKCHGFKLENGKWAGNARELFKTGTAGLEDLIVFKEDVFEYMQAHGIDRNNAFKISEDVARGRVHRNGWSQDSLAILNNSNVPDWYRKSCEKIMYLGSRAHSILVLKHFCPKEIEEE